MLLNSVVVTLVSYDKVQDFATYKGCKIKKIDFSAQAVACLHYNE